MSKTGGVEKLLCPDLRHEELLTDGPNNFNQQIETEETTEVKKTLMMNEKMDGDETADVLDPIKRYLFIVNHIDVFDLFMPHIVFAAAIIFFIQSLCILVVVFS